MEKKCNFLPEIARLLGRDASELQNLSHKELALHLLDFPIDCRKSEKDFLKLSIKAWDYCFQKDKDMAIELMVKCFNISSIPIVLEMKHKRFKSHIIAIFSKERWLFMKTFYKKALLFEDSKEALKKVSFYVLQYITPTGYLTKKTDVDHIFIEATSFNRDSFFQWHYDLVVNNSSFEECYEAFANPNNWESFMPFFLANRKKLSIKSFCKNALSKEPFYKRIWISARLFIGF